MYKSISFLLIMGTQAMAGDLSVGDSGGAPYFPHTCTVEDLKQHEKDIKEFQKANMAYNPDPPCVFLGEQHKKDLYIQLGKELSKE